jgi:hypothetical protein
MEGFTQIVHPLTALTNKDTCFVWLTACERSFERLKMSYVSVPIFCHFNPERKRVVETDASNLLIIGALSQYDNDDILHPVAYFSRKFSTAEINCEIYDKEHLAIVRAFKEWHPLLEDSRHTIKVIYDH